MFLIISHHFTANTEILDMCSMWFATLPIKDSFVEPRPLEPIMIRLVSSICFLLNKSKSSIISNPYLDIFWITYSPASVATHCLAK